MKTDCKNIDEYIALHPSNVGKLLKKIRQKIKDLIPEASETISYGIPTFQFYGNLVHFAGFKNHIGFYPGANVVENFRTDLLHYKTSKGTIQFQLTEEIPFDLIEKIILFRVNQNIEKNKNNKK